MGEEDGGQREGGEEGVAKARAGRVSESEIKERGNPAVGGEKPRVAGYKNTGKLGGKGKKK